jgi:hypothetical protein
VKHLSTTTDVLRLTVSLHFSNSGCFDSLGWEDLPRSLLILREEDERSLLHTMLPEQNFKFALQLDTCPITGRSSQLATDSPEENRYSIVLSGGSHLVRLINHLESANLWVVDFMVLGFLMTDSVITDIAAGMAEKVAGLNPDKFIVSVQLLDNIVFVCKQPNGDRFCLIGKEMVNIMLKESFVSLGRTH